MKVLLTGGNGFLAAHCVDCLLQRGHDVIFTVRSDDKGQKVLKSYANLPRNRLSYVIVKDIAQETAFDEAVKSDPPFDVVLHMASPFHFNVTTAKELIDPAVIGTTGILRAIQKSAQSVKRVVITSSFGSMINPKRHPEVYSEAHWNPITEEEALGSLPSAYAAGKVFAERAAWDFIEKEKPNFDLATINPPLILGPVVNFSNSQDTVNTSNSTILGLIQGNFQEGLPPTLVCLWVDVRDAALAHVKAAEIKDAGGMRFFTTAGYFTNADIANIIKNKFPSLAEKLPSELQGDLPPDYFGFDNSRSKEILKLEYRTLEESVTDTVKSLLDAGV